MEIGGEDGERGKKWKFVLTQEKDKNMRKMQPYSNKDGDDVKLLLSIVQNNYLQRDNSKKLKSKLLMYSSVYTNIYTKQVESYSS